MVTEAAPATETLAAPESITPGDAGETQVADAATQEVESFLDSRGKESAESATEPSAETTPDPVDVELEAAKAAAVAVATEKATADANAKIAADKAAADAQAVQHAATRAFEQGYRNRLQAVGQETYQTSIDLGYSEEEARQRATKAQQVFNSHHADGLKLYEPQAQQRAAASFVQGFNEGLLEVLDESEQAAALRPEGYPSQKEFLVALKAVWQKDRMTPTEVKAHTTRALLDYRHALEAQGLIAGSISGATSNGRAVSGGWRTKEQARNLHAQDKLPGGNAEMRRINADPTIPDGYR